jgi:hypothetical protein
MTDDTYTGMGATWRRQWVGDNSGRYEWTSDDGRLVVWRDGHDYRATLDGYPSTKTWPRLTTAMLVSVRSRDAHDRKRQTA